jgi:hypothetical protein
MLSSPCSPGPSNTAVPWSTTAKACLIAAGLELTRSNHLALTHLYTCRKYLLGTVEEHQWVGIRIEIAFLPDQNPDSNPDQNPDQPLLSLRSTRTKAA